MYRSRPYELYAPLAHLHHLRHQDRVNRAVQAVLARYGEAVALVSVSYRRRGESARAAHDGRVVDELVAEAPAERRAAGNGDERRVEGEVVDEHLAVRVEARERAAGAPDPPGDAATAPLGERQAHGGRGVAPVEAGADRLGAGGRGRAALADRAVCGEVHVRDAHDAHVRASVVVCRRHAELVAAPDGPAVAPLVPVDRLRVRLVEERLDAV